VDSYTKTFFGKQKRFLASCVDGKIRDMCRCVSAIAISRLFFSSGSGILINHDRNRERRS